MNMSLIIMEGNYCDIYDDDHSCRGYYIIKFSSSPYTLQSYLIIDGRVIYSVEMVSKGNFFFPINISSRYYFSQKNNPITQLFL